MKLFIFIVYVCPNLLSSNMFSIESTWQMLSTGDKKNMGLKLTIAQF